MTLVWGFAAVTLWPAPATQAQPSATGSLRVIVLDPSGASIPTASIILEREDLPPGAAVSSIRRSAAPSGTAVAEALALGRYLIRVDAPGFASRELTNVRIGPGDTRRTVRLAIAKAQETVRVDQDRQSAALDPRGFSTFLSREQIEALPDDPEEFARALRDLAPPGAVIRIDGFTGGRLPPKSQILSIRIPRLDTFAAQDHGGLSALSFIDIVTRPGGGRVQATTEMSLRTAALNARNALARERGEESLLVAGLAIDGPIVPEKVSFSLSARGGTQRETALVRAATGGGTIHTESVAQPQDNLTFSGRLAAALRGDQTLRVSFSADRRTARHLGVGDRNLPDRGYQASSSDAAIRAAVGGPVGGRALVESRIQLRWHGTRTVSDVEAPTLRVIDAFSSGGAQLTGGARSFDLLAASDIDYARGAHAWRAGVLIEAGRYRSKRRANYLGTFTFASLDDYARGAPTAFTKRFGDAHADYQNAQIGLYIQDDVRIARSLLLSYGVRYERQTLVDDPVSLLPRAGMAWSPFRTARTTVRAGWGLFSDWLPVETYEQSIVVDGLRQHDIQIPHPMYPDAGSSGQHGPIERYMLNPDLRLPAGVGMSLALEHRLTPGIRLYASYGHRAGHRRLRGRNLNPPLDGQRLDPAFGNVIESVSDARSRSHTATVQAVRSNPLGRLDVSMIYAYSNDRTNTTGPFGLPAGGFGLEAEWGPAGPAHVATGMVTARVARALSVSLMPRWRSGTPYTLTTGHDDNGDGLFTDRPAGVSRQSERTAHQWDIGARVTYVVRFGRPRDADLFSSAGGDAQSARAGTVVPDSARDLADVRRYRIEVFTSAQNLTNHPNYTAVSGVQGSPFFGQPTIAGSPRRLDVGVRFGF